MSEELKTILERIANKLDELDKRVSRLEGGKTETKRNNVIETSRFTAKVDRARKGVGLALKFAKFVKVENNAVYVVLSEDEAMNFVKSLYREISNVVNGAKSEAKRKSAEKTKVRVVEE